MNLPKPALNGLSAGTASPPVPIGRPNRSWDLAERVSEICERYRLHGWQISFRDLRRGGWDVEVSLPLPEENSQAELAMDEIVRLLRAARYEVAEPLANWWQTIWVLRATNGIHLPVDRRHWAPPEIDIDNNHPAPQLEALQCITWKDNEPWWVCY